VQPSSLVDRDKEERPSWNDDMMAGEHRKLATKRAKGPGEQDKKTTRARVITVSDLPL
jgi:hypothetical protein